MLVSHILIVLSREAEKSFSLLGAGMKHTDETLCSWPVGRAAVSYTKPGTHSAHESVHMGDSAHETSRGLPRCTRLTLVAGAQVRHVAGCVRDSE